MEKKHSADSCSDIANIPSQLHSVECPKPHGQYSTDEYRLTAPFGQC